MSERIFFLVGAKSPVMKVIQDVRRINREFQQALKLVRDQYGATDAWHEDYRFAGLTFSGKPPAGWRKRKNYCVPDKRTKEGRAIADALVHVPRGVNILRFGRMLSDALKQDLAHWGRTHVSFPSLHNPGGKYILGVPLACKTTSLPGCRELRMSEVAKLLPSLTKEGNE